MKNFKECLIEAGFDQVEYIYELNDTVYDVKKCLEHSKSSAWLNSQARIREMNEYGEITKMIDARIPGDTKTFLILQCPAVAMSGAAASHKIHTYFGNLI